MLLRNISLAVLSMFIYLLVLAKIGYKPDSQKVCCIKQN